jgi:hypothetical protein
MVLIRFIFLSRITICCQLCRVPNVGSTFQVPTFCADSMLSFKESSVVKDAYLWFFFTSIMPFFCSVGSSKKPKPFQRLSGCHQSVTGKFLLISHYPVNYCSAQHCLLIVVPLCPPTSNFWILPVSGRHITAFCCKHASLQFV